MTTEADDGISHPRPKKIFSEQEKRDYYSAWENSGMNKRRFCKEHELSIDEFSYWHKVFKPKPQPKSLQFSPVVAKTASAQPAPTKQQQDVTQIELRLPNQAQLFITLREHQLVSFIQELCNAVTIIR